MAYAIKPEGGTLTVVDLAERFGAMPISRIRLVPAPGTAREEDVVQINDREDRLCELVDGVLVEKTVGAYESYLAVALVRLLGNFVSEHHLGIVLGADGMMRLAPGLVRIPDVSFISFERLPHGKVPHTAFFELAPGPGRGDPQPQQYPQGNAAQAGRLFYFGRPARLVRLPREAEG